MMEDASCRDSVTDIIFTNDRLIVQDAVDLVSCEYCGATSVFLGLLPLRIAIDYFTRRFKFFLRIRHVML